MPRKTYKKIIVTDELLQQINPENKKLVERFLKEKGTRTSDGTIKNYTSCANIFFVWNLLHNSNKHFTEIKKLDFADFFSFSTNELRWGSSRNNGTRSFLSSLSNFIEKFYDEEYPTFRNVVLKTIESIPKEFTREKTILSTEQVESLLRHLSEIDSQKACWVALAAYSGARFSELLRFTTDMLDENHTAFGDLFMETTRKIRTKGRGKTGKLLSKYILKEQFLPYYRAWLLDREKIISANKLEDHKSLFVRDDGSPAMDGTIRAWFPSFEKFLGVSVYPHAFRHFLVTEFSKKNIPPALIKDIVGWSNIVMVEHYNDLEAKDMQWKELDNLK